MELNHKTITLSVQGHLDGDIKVLKNGQDEGIKLKHLFKEVWFTTGKIQGYSVLEFYTVQDGFLVDNDGNKISFSCERFPEINILKLADPSFPSIIYDEVEVTPEWVVDRFKLLGARKIEDMIKNIPDEDKVALIAEIEKVNAERLEAETKAKAEEDERLAEEARKAEEEATTAAEIKKAEEARIKAEEDAARSEAERIKAEKEADEAREAAEKAAIAAEEERKRIEAEEAPYILSEAQYNTTKRRYSKAYGMKEYVNGTYNFFYAPKSNLPKDMSSYILRKKEDGTYLQLEGGIALEDEEVVEFEFTDKGVDKVLFLNLDNEEVTIE